MFPYNSFKGERRKKKTHPEEPVALLLVGGPASSRHCPGKSLYCTRSAQLGLAAGERIAGEKKLTGHHQTTMATAYRSLCSTVLLMAWNEAEGLLCCLDLHNKPSPAPITGGPSKIAAEFCRTETSLCRAPEVGRAFVPTAGFPAFDSLRLNI